MPGYSYIQAGPDGAAPCYGSGCASAITNANNRFNGGYSNFSAQNLYLPQQIALLYINKIPTQVFTEQLFLNKSGTSYSQLLGYHRLMFVYADAFNNIIYQPIDADIANLTQINMTVTPIVSSTNANDTLINISGTAGWIPQGSATYVPLKKSPIYIYYDSNLNTVGYNAIGGQGSGATEASQCTYNLTRQVYDPGCQLANPVITGLQGSGFGTPAYIGPNTIGTQYSG